ncbi:hypothetical protein DFH06DRAFT_1309794 [Mycena polygramma]|nr:hypothetical protein DFH06DRAFT_1309794 [Mycena polygramma]
MTVSTRGWLLISRSCRLASHTSWSSGSQPSSASDRKTPSSRTTLVTNERPDPRTLCVQASIGYRMRVRLELVAPVAALLGALSRSLGSIRTMLPLQTRTRRTSASDSITGDLLVNSCINHRPLNVDGRV